MQLNKYSPNISSKLFGIFFIFAFISYGLGSELINTLLTSSNPLINIFNNKNQVVFSIILMALVHSFVNIGAALTISVFLKPFNKRVAHAYIYAVLISTTFLIVGALFLILLIPLSEQYVQADFSVTSHFDTINALLQKGYFYSYQIGMNIWGLGGLFLCYLLSLSKLVPSKLIILGFVGYVIFIIGTILELFGYEVGLIFSIPGGLFEILLSIYVIIKGFNIKEKNDIRTPCL